MVCVSQMHLFGFINEQILLFYTYVVNQQMHTDKLWFIIILIFTYMFQLLLWPKDTFGLRTPGVYIIT